MRRLRKPERLALLAAAVGLSIGVAGAWRQAPRQSAGAQQARSTASRATAVAVGPIGVTVDDMDRALAFYTTVLPFERVSDERVATTAAGMLSGLQGARRVARLRLGEEILELTDYLEPGGQPIPADSRSQDHWFQHIAIIVRDMDRAYARLRAHDVDHVSPGPQRLPNWNPNAAGIRAFYFRDPDRHVLEILAFPEGKGEARWHWPGESLFLGIDHTAIVVQQTARSLDFYGGELGLVVAGTSENHGIEQERLNNVAGAHLRITTLRGFAGPGVEFLEYLKPADGRPRPAGTRANDLMHWETTIATPDLQRLSRRLLDRGVLFISPLLVRLAGTHASLVRDPDGHAVKLVERTS